VRNLEPMSVSLIGFMASGKSTVGVLLAEALGVPFVDLDERIEQREGASVSMIFEQRGESGFRAAERAALLSVLDGPPAVLACGGGTPCQPGAMHALGRWGQTVFLQVPLDRLRERTAADPNERPLWDEDVARRYMERLPVYRAADWIVDGTQPRTAVVGAILKALEVGVE